MLLGVVDLLVAAHAPLADGGELLELREEAGPGDLEADLVVALAGGAVGDGVGIFAEGDFADELGDEGAGQGGGEGIAVLVTGVRFEGGKDEVAGELFLGVDHLCADGADIEGLLPDAVVVALLAEVDGDGVYVHVVVFFHPADGDGGVEPSRIG